MAITRPGSGGYGIRRGGPFDKYISPHPVGRITRLGSGGYGIRRAGSFFGKTPDDGGAGQASEFIIRARRRGIR